jgi:hypothetical protein
MAVTAITAEVTGAIRDLSSGMEARGRRIVRDAQAPPAQVLAWMASAFAASASFFNAGATRPEALVVPGTAGWAIVDRELTRC